MRKYKKIFIIAAIAVVVLAASLGAVAIVQADTNTTSTTTTSVFSDNRTSLYDKVAAILKQNNGVNITGADLQKAFQQAQQQAASDALDNMLQKLVADGKITKQQATDYKNWLSSKPTEMFSDQYKQWLQSKPNIPGMPGLSGNQGFGQQMPRMGGSSGGMFHR
jgi:ABC-type glycerol-3-phosphate transport system substrate-binding protein